MLHMLLLLCMNGDLALMIKLSSSRAVLSRLLEDFFLYKCGKYGVM